MNRGGRGEFLLPGPPWATRRMGCEDPSTVPGGRSEVTAGPVVRGAVLLRWFGGGLTVPQWPRAPPHPLHEQARAWIEIRHSRGRVRCGLSGLPDSPRHEPDRYASGCPAQEFARLVLLTLRVLYQPRRVLILLANFVRRSSIRPTAPAQRRSEKTKRARQPRSSTPGGGVIRQSSRVPAMRALEGWLGRANVSATRWPPS